MNGGGSEHACKDMRARARERVLFFDLRFALDEIYAVDELRGEKDEITLGARKEKGEMGKTHKFSCHAHHAHERNGDNQEDDIRPGVHVGRCLSELFSLSSTS